MTPNKIIKCFSLPWCPLFIGFEYQWIWIIRLTSMKTMDTNDIMNTKRHFDFKTIRILWPSIKSALFIFLSVYFNKDNSVSIKNRRHFYCFFLVTNHFQFYATIKKTFDTCSWSSVFFSITTKSRWNNGKDMSFLSFLTSPIDRWISFVFKGNNWIVKNTFVWPSHLTASKNLICISTWLIG